MASPPSSCPARSAQDALQPHACIDQAFPAYPHERPTLGTRLCGTPRRLHCDGDGGRDCITRFTVIEAPISAMGNTQKVVGRLHQSYGC